jgi:hypothetical protein
MAKMKFSHVGTNLDEVGMAGQNYLGWGRFSKSASVFCILSMKDQGDRSKIAMPELWPTNKLYCSDWEFKEP